MAPDVSSPRTLPLYLNLLGRCALFAEYAVECEGALEIKSGAPGATTGGTQYVYDIAGHAEKLTSWHCPYSFDT